MNCIALLLLLFCGGNQGKYAAAGKDLCASGDCQRGREQCADRERDCQTAKQEDCGCRRCETEQEGQRSRSWERPGRQEACEGRERCEDRERSGREARCEGRERQENRERCEDKERQGSRERCEWGARQERQERCEGQEQRECRDCRDMNSGMTPPPWNNRSDIYETGRQNSCRCEERE